MKKTKGTGAMLFSMIAVIVIICLFIVAGNGAKKEAASKEIRVGLLLYRGDDTFISTLRSYIEEKAKEYERKEGIKVTLDILDAKSNQNTQNNQVDRMLELGCDALCVNIVDRFAASVVIDKAMAADVPVIFFNRELVQEDLERWDKLYYVGADAFESGELQGDILVEKCKKDFNRIDKNGDGVLQYIMLEGEAGHNDSMVRTMSVINEITGNGYQVEKLSDEIANWNRDQAANKMKQFLERFGNRIEVVLANNDDMALGAVDALEAAGYDPDSQDWPMVLGIDGTTVGLNAVNDGKMLGTVLNDAAGQADGMLELARSITAGTKLSEEYELQDGKYIRMPYRIVTQENLGEIQMLLMK